MKNFNFNENEQDNLIPASFNQREAAFMDTVYGRAGMFCHYADIAMDGPVNRAEIEEKLRKLLVENKNLRGILRRIDGKHFQQILPASLVQSSICLGYMDMTELDVDKQHYLINKYWQDEEEKGFDINNEIPIRATLAKLGMHNYRLFLSAHHLACDERSLNRIIYILTDSNADHAILDAEESGIVNNNDPQELADYWQTRLYKCPSIYAYPVSETRKDNRLFSMKWSNLNINKEFSTSVNNIVNELEITTEEYFLAVFQLFLHLYCQQEYCAVGVNYYPVQQEEIIGNYVNRLPLVSRLTADISVKQWIEQTKNNLYDSYTHGELPFGEIVDCVHAEKSTNFHPVFQSLFLFEKTPSSKSWFRADSTAPTYSHFDIKIRVAENSNKEYEINLGLSDELFGTDTQTEILTYFSNLMENILADSLEKSVANLQLTNSAQMANIVKEWSKPLPGDESFPAFHAGFEQQVEVRPDRIAIFHYDEVVTYDELNKRANQCARVMKRRTNKHQAKISLESVNPLHMMIAILAAMKAGCVHIAIDPALPLKRVNYINQDAEVDLFITYTKERYQADGGDVDIMSFDELFVESANAATDNLNLEVSSSDIAYYIFTSGSTGMPKGIMIKHSSVVNIGLAMKDILDVTPESCFLLFASFSFDASVNDWSSALLNGASLALIKRRDTNIVDEVKNAFKRHKISIALIPPSFLSFFHPSDFPSLKTLMVGAEPVSQQVVDKWCDDFKLINIYGPTETTVICCTFDCDRVHSANTIGTAVENYVLMVLDRHLNPLPPNVVGELYIGGIGLARGYLGAEELTRNSFINANIQGYGEVRLYKSNDLVKLSHEGNIEFIRRNDKIEKIRGFRVSLTEIDHALENHPYVDHAVSISNNDNNEQSIISYVVLDSTSMSKFDSVDKWKNIFENVIDYDSRNVDTAFNVSGWTNSYTDEDISDAEMKTWLDGTVDRIAGLQPQNLLEVGCGSGMLLFNLAPRLKKYIGTDISRDALISIKNNMPEGGINGVDIAVHQMQADDLEKFGDNIVDTIICNSVIQYFPSVQYFLNVMDDFFRVLEDGGSIFLGDIRNKNLATHFHALVENAKSKEIGTGDFHVKVAQRVHRDSEFLIDPELFRYLKLKYPQISNVRILIKRGMEANELTQFRYDVIIETKAKDNYASATEYSWHETGTMQSVEDKLKTLNNLVIRDVPNALLTKAVELVGDKHIGSFASQAKIPEEFYHLGDKMGFYTEVSYSNNKDNCYFDVGFSKQGFSVLKTDWPQSVSLEMEAPRRANIPFEAQREIKCVDEISDYLKAELPGFMRPKQIICIDSIPYNISGKLDRHRLPTMKNGQRLIRTDIRELNTPTEKALGKIWKRILDVDTVSQDDNFFDLGGTSFTFLGFVTELEDELGIKIPVMDIMRSTLSEMSVKIDRMHNSH